LIRIGPRYKVDISPVLLCGSLHPFTHSRPIIEVCAAKALKASLQNKHLKFFHAFNAIVILHLTLSACLPVLFYGLESISDNSVLRSVQFCRSIILLRAFIISSVDNNALVGYFAGILPRAFAVDLRKLRYYSKLYSIDSMDNLNANIGHIIYTTIFRFIYYKHYEKREIAKTSRTR